MKLSCRILRHRPPIGRPIWNDGYFFGACPRCGADIVRHAMSGRWSAVPPGYRVAWRERTPADIVW